MLLPLFQVDLCAGKLWAVPIAQCPRRLSSRTSGQAQLYTGQFESCAVMHWNGNRCAQSGKVFLNSCIWLAGWGLKRHVLHRLQTIAGDAKDWTRGLLCAKKTAYHYTAMPSHWGEGNPVTPLSPTYCSKRQILILAMLWDSFPSQSHSNEAQEMTGEWQMALLSN